MAYSSSSPRTWQYNVFTSFHGPDVRKTFLSHLRKQFNFNGITMFDDQGIERSKIIAPALTQAIRGSRISIIVLSKKYASSSWCLDELLEIMKCRKELGQIVMTVFYDVDPSDVRNQTGDFGITFRKTCARKKEQRRKWSQALTDVGNLAGEHFLKWENEAEMIEKIARDVSGKLNATPCRDFDDMVGLDNHLKEMESLLDLNNTDVKVVGISGPAGIGKSTIARALHSRLSNMFQHTCFLENLRDNYKIGRDGYGLKLSLHKQLLSKILNQNSMQISNLGVIEQRLHDKKVLIILDDVESVDQLETLANIIWFGAGSRVIVTTENKEILQRHGINDIYHVGFPSSREALMIFCLSAFRQNSPPDGFMNLAVEIAKISGNLPLGLRILGLSLRGKSQTDWIDELPRLKNCLNGDIERVLKEGYESLHEKDQALFLFIAVFLNYKHVDHVTSVLEKTNLDVRLGLKKLANRHLIHIGHGSIVVMHHLLQVMARQVASQQQLSKHKILVDAKDICDVLQKAEDDGSIKGISFDAAEIDELMINPRAFEKMCNLLFLKVYNVGCHTGKRKLHIPVDIEFPCRIRLLHWDRYSGKSLPLRFSPENLVELNMEGSQLEKLWEGTKLLGNLKKINLFGSTSLKELPDLSNATNLERLNLSFCKSLEIVPTLVNLASLTWIKMYRCSRLSRFPEIPTNIKSLQITAATLEEVPASLTHCSRLKIIEIFNSVNLKTFLTQLPTSVEHINLCYCGIERITDSIKGLHNLRVLYLSSCKRLASLPELPCSLKSLHAENCESLERVNGHLNTPNAHLDFTNCFKLDREARRAIIQQSFGNGSAQLPGIEVPAEFEYRARGSSITIPNFGFIKCKVCIVKAPKSAKLQKAPVRLQKAHLLMYSIVFDIFDTSSRVFDFKSELQDFDIIECGVQILRDETDGSNNSGSGDEDDESSDKEEEDDDSAIQSESSEVSDKEDDEEGYNSESGEETEESVSRKRPRNLKKWILCPFFIFLFCFLFLL